MVDQVRGEGGEKYNSLVAKATIERLLSWASVYGDSVGADVLKIMRVQELVENWRVAVTVTDTDAAFVIGPFVHESTRSVLPFVGINVNSMDMFGSTPSTSEERQARGAVLGMFAAEFVPRVVVYYEDLEQRGVTLVNVSEFMALNRGSR